MLRPRKHRAVGPVIVAPDRRASCNHQRSGMPGPRRPGRGQATGYSAHGPATGKKCGFGTTRAGP